MKYEIKCRHCSRFLGVTDKSVEVTIKCSSSKCKKMDSYRIKFLTDMIGEKHTHAKQ